MGLPYRIKHLRYELNYMEIKGLSGERLTRALPGTTSQLPHQLAELYGQFTLEKLPIPQYVSHSGTIQPEPVQGRVWRVWKSHLL